VARSIEDPGERVWELITLSSATLAVGDRDRFTRLVDRAEAVNASLRFADDRDVRRYQLVPVLARAGDFDRAEDIVAAMTEPFWRIRALADLSAQLTASGDVSKGGALADQAQSLAEEQPYPFLRGATLADLAYRFARAGDTARAGRLVDRAEATIPAIAADDDDMRDRVEHEAQTLASLALAAGRAGDHTRAEQFAGRVESMLSSLPGQVSRATMLQWLAAGPARTRDRQLAQIDRAEEATLKIDIAVERHRLLADLAAIRSKAGDHAGAERVVRTIPAHNSYVSKALIAAAEALAEAGEVDRAEAVARSASNPSDEAAALIEVAARADPERARPLVAQALRVADWTAPLRLLPSLEPDAVSALADDLLQH
jgi:hypothetical protein